jgi:hypothetical protein
LPIAAIESTGNAETNDELARFQMEGGYYEGVIVKTR